MTITDVEKFCKDLRIGLMESNVELDNDEVRISMRDDADDEPSQTTIIAARSVVKEIKEKFGELVKINHEIIDEWVDVTVSLR